jgi:hypothetical protein
MDALKLEAEISAMIVDAPYLLNIAAGKQDESLKL